MTTADTSETLKRHCQALFEFLGHKSDGGFSSSSDDDMAFMAITFVVKQWEHLGSLGLLITNERYFDAGLIARTMLEGTALLAWASHAPVERAGKWKAYSVVFDLRTMNKERQEGRDVSAELEGRILSAAHALGGPFLKKGKSEADLEDPNAYENRWHVDEAGKRLTVTSILSELGNQTLLDIYDDLSSWVHWNAKGLGAALSRNGDRVLIDFASREYGNLAMVVGFIATLLSLQILDQHLHLGLEEQLCAFRDNFVADLSPGKAA